MERHRGDGASGQDNKSKSSGDRKQQEWFALDSGAIEQPGQPLNANPLVPASVLRSAVLCAPGAVPAETSSARRRPKRWLLRVYRLVKNIPAIGCCNGEPREEIPGRGWE